MNTEGQSSIELLIAVGALLTILMAFSSILMEQNQQLSQIKAGKKIERVEKSVSESQLECFSNREINEEKKEGNSRWFR